MNPELRRYLERDFHERVLVAERAYRDAARAAKEQFEDSRNSGSSKPEGACAYQSAVAAERDAMEAYQRALEVLSEFLLHQKMPATQNLLQPVLTKAIEATGADMGNIQVFARSEDALKIAAHSGFKRPFLEFFATVREERGSSCGAALKTAQRVVVDDVTTSLIFVGTPALKILLDAGVQACQSTPLLSPAGELMGMLSTHYRRPTRPTDSDFEALDRLAPQAAAFIMAS